MIKFVGGVMVGIFVGALTIEVLGKRYPWLLDKVEKKGRRAAEMAEGLFRRQRMEEPSHF